MTDRNGKGAGERGDPSPEVAPTPADTRSSTVGTGSALGIGCLILVVLFVVIAVAWRLLGGGW